MEIDVLLCDYAQVSGEKLFISGANIDRMVVAADSPAPYIVTFSAAGLVHVPWTATNTEHTLAFTLVTEDGQIPELPPGMEVPESGIGGEMRFNVGRPPQLSAGETQNVPFAFNFQHVPLMRSGRYSVQFSLDAVPVRHVPFAVFVEPSRGFRAGGVPGQ